MLICLIFLIKIENVYPKRDPYKELVVLHIISIIYFNFAIKPGNFFEVIDKRWVWAQF